jgi:hypothetical protein
LAPGVTASWSNTAKSTTPTGRTFLGQFGNQTVNLTLNGLPAHNLLSIEFDLFVLKTWDGSDTGGWGQDHFAVSAGVTTLLDATFANRTENNDGHNNATQSFCGQDQPLGEYSGFSGALESGTLGYSMWRAEFNRYEDMSAVYRLSYTISDSAASKTFSFKGYGLQGIADESWGLDNVTVRAASLTANPDNYTVSPNKTLTVESLFGVLSNDILPAPGDFTASLANGPTNGNLTFNGNGSFSYTPNTNFLGDDSFQYTLTDTLGNSSSAVVNLSVRNSAPVTNDDFFSVVHDRQLTGNVLSNDYDIDEDTLQTILTGTGHGTVALTSAGGFTYTPQAGFVGEDSFQYTSTDGEFTETATVTILVTNEAPEARDDSFGLYQGETLTANVLENDQDPDQDSLTVELVSSTTNGTVTLGSDGTFTYTPTSGFIGTDSFSYIINDGLVDGNTVIVFLFVLAQGVGGGADFHFEMPGVNAKDLVAKGGFIPINADNDNGSAVTNGKPAVRDFDRLTAMAAADLDLKEIKVTINAAAAMPGTFVLSKTDNLRLWTDQKKTKQITPGDFTQATLPKTIFVEGIKPSTKLKDSWVRIAYTPAAGDTFKASTAQIDLSVTPFLLALTGQPRFIFPRTRNVPGFGETLTGLSTAGFFGGMTVTARGHTEGATRGQLAFIQNGSVKNGKDGGLAFTAKSKLKTHDLKLFDGVKEKTWVLDTGPDSPLYYPSDEVGGNLPGESSRMMPDSPNFGISYRSNPVDSVHAENLNVTYQYKTWAVWAMPEGTDTLWYPLGVLSWEVGWRGEKNQQVGVGGAKYSGLADLSKNYIKVTDTKLAEHSDPHALTGIKMNDAFKWVAH